MFVKGALFPFFGSQKVAIGVVPLRDLRYVKL